MSVPSSLCLPCWSLLCLLVSLPVAAQPAPDAGAPDVSPEVVPDDETAPEPGQGESPSPAETPSEAAPDPGTGPGPAGGGRPSEEPAADQGASRGPGAGEPPPAAAAPPEGEVFALPEEEVFALPEEDALLAPDTVHRVDQVVVTASRGERRLSDVPVATEVVTRDEIRLSGARDVSEVLEEQPGIDIVRNVGNAGVRIQGLDSKYVLILVDGERVTGRVDDVVDLARYRAENIERVEIVRGPSSALYGSDAVAGVVNIITRGAERPLESRASAMYGTLNRFEVDASAGARQGILDSRISASFRRRDGFDRDPSDLTTDVNTLDETALDQRTKVSLGEDWSLLTHGTYRTRYSAGVVENGAGFVADQSNDTEEWLLSARAETELGEVDRLSLSAHYTRFTNEYVQDQRVEGVPDIAEPTRDQLGRLGTQLDLLLGERHMWTAGTELLLERIDSDRVSDERADGARLSFYTQDEWQVIDSTPLTLVPGVRLALDSRFGVYPNPKLALRLDATEDLIVRASYGFAFRAPSFRELALRFVNTGANYRVDGNPDLDPERSRAGNLSVEYSPAEWLWLSLNLFRNDLSNTIQPDAVDGGEPGEVVNYRYVNIAEAHTQGVESTVRVDPVKGLTLEASYTLTDARDDTEDRPLSGRARHRGTFKVSYRNRGLGFAGTARAGLWGSRPFYLDLDGDGDDDDRQTLDPLAFVDLRAEQDVADWLTLYVGVNNLLDASNARDMQVLPRTFYGGVVIDI